MPPTPLVLQGTVQARSMDPGRALLPPPESPGHRIRVQDPISPSPTAEARTFDDAGPPDPFRTRELRHRLDFLARAMTASTTRTTSSDPAPSNRLSSTGRIASSVAAGARDELQSSLRRATLPPADVRSLVGTTTSGAEDRPVATTRTRRPMRGRGTMLVSDSEDDDLGEGDGSEDEGYGQDRTMFHINGHALRLPSSLRLLNPVIMHDTLRNEVNMWRDRRRAVFEAIVLDYDNRAGGTEAPRATMSTLDDRLAELDRAWTTQRRYLSDRDCERVDAAWNDRPPPATPPSGGSPARSSTARTQEETMAQIAHIESARASIERAAAQVEEAMRTLQGHRAERTTAESELRTAMNAAETGLRAGMASLGYNHIVPGGSPRRGSLATRPDGREPVQRMLSTLESTMRTLTTFVSSHPLRSEGSSDAPPASIPPTTEPAAGSSQYLSTLAQIDSLLQRSRDTRSSLESVRRRQSAVRTGGAPRTSPRPNVVVRPPPPPIVVTRRRSRDVRSETPTEAAASSSAEELADKEKPPVGRDGELKGDVDDGPKLKPLRKVTLEERLLVGHGPWAVSPSRAGGGATTTGGAQALDRSKRVKLPVDDATIRVRVLRRRGVLKAR